MYVFFQKIGNVKGGLPPIQMPPFSFDGNGTEPVNPIDPEWGATQKNDFSYVILFASFCI